MGMIQSFRGTTVIFLFITGGCAVSPCSLGVICRNIGLGGYKCDDCLPGYKNGTGGNTCTDINEVNYNKLATSLYKWNLRSCFPLSVSTSMD